MQSSVCSGFELRVRGTGPGELGLQQRCDLGREVVIELVRGWKSVSFLGGDGKKGIPSLRSGLNKGPN